MALTKVTGQVINNSTGLVVGVTTVGGGLSATDGFFSGIVTAVGNASFSGNVSVGGTLTYEDVTNIDAVGLITARNGVVVGSGITLSKDGDGFFTGVVTATSYAGDGSSLTGIAATDNVRTGILDVAGVGTFRGDVNIPDKIIHLGDTDTAIRFPAADTITLETAGSERLRTDSSGGVHIATTSGNEKLNVNGAVRVSGSSADFNAGLEGALVDYDTSNNIARFGHVNGASGSARSVTFLSGGSEKVRIDSSGNVGIGTDAINYPSGGGLTIYNATAPRLRLCNSSTGTGTHDGAEISIDNTTKDLYIENRESEDIIFYSGSERMRISSAGKVGINCTPDYLFNVVSDSNDMCRFQQTTNDGGSSYSMIFMKHAAARSGSNGIDITFQNDSGTTVGMIDHGQSTTQYRTSSDYRLKENAETISDGITRLKTLKPYRFNWISEPGQPKVDGFFAHEVTAVPEAIKGTKDEVDSDNKPLYQSIDHSKLVPLLTAALQEAVAKIEVLESEVAALKGS